MAELIATSSENQVDVTSSFLSLFKILFFQNVLFILLLCSCCFAGRAHAKVYDRLFIMYTVLLILSVGTFIWSVVLRQQYTSKVCSGDFLAEHEIDYESAIIVMWDVEHEFYLIQCGRVIRWFIIIESLFFFCCTCASSVWVVF